MQKNVTICSIKIFLHTMNCLNMPNLQQNNEIEHINKEINLLQDLIKKNEKSLNQFKNGLMQIGRIQVKKEKVRIFFKPNNYKI